MPQRDDFSEPVKRALAGRVGNLCSNPDCRAWTSGPHQDAAKVVNLGVAAHITAAAPGGPRYDASLTPEQRSSAENAIWLCQNCAKLIDSDPLNFPVSLLRDWKAMAEEEARAKVGKTAASPAATTSGSIFNINIENTTIGSMAFGDGSTSSGKVDLGRIEEKPPCLQFASIAIDRADTNWAQVLETMMYEVSYVFRKSLFVLADPTLDVTVLNNGTKPLVLSRVGIKIVSIALRTRVAGFQHPEEIPKTHSYIVEIDDAVARILHERIPESHRRSWSYGPMEINHCFWLTLPNPIRVPPLEPFRYGLLLKNFCEYLPNFCCVALLAMTNIGESASPLIEMRSW